MKTETANAKSLAVDLVGGAFGGRRHRRGKRRLSQYRVPSPGDFCKAFVPFTNGEGGKIRSVLVLSAEPLDFIVVPVTGGPPEWKFEVPIQYWRAAGMSRPGTVRCPRICAVAREKVYGVLGRVLPDDLRRVLASSKEWFAAVIDSASAFNLAGFDGDITSENLRVGMAA